MKSTMQTTPLLISSLLRYGTTVHGASEVVTWTADGGRRTTFRQLGQQAAQLANALRRLGITADQRIATFMWNNAEHLAVYLAVPSMGAVLHALNIRLFPEQLVYVTRHGGSEIVIVDNTLAQPFSRLLPHLPAVRHVIVNGPIDDETRAALGAPRRWRLSTTSKACWPTSRRPSTGATTSTRTTQRPCATPPARPATPRESSTRHRSNYLHSMAVAATLGITSADRLLIVVPLFHANAWGFPYSAMVSGATLVMPDRFLQAVPADGDDPGREGDRRGRCADDLERPAHHLDAEKPDVSSVRMLMVGGSAARRLSSGPSPRTTASTSSTAGA